VVVDGVTGFLVPFKPDKVTGFPVDGDGFARDLARAIAELMDNPHLCQRMGAQGRRRVEEMFAWEAIAGQTVKLYQDLLARRK
jgi:starch synthase